MRKQDGYRVIVGVSKNIVGRYHCTAAEIDFDSFHNSYSLLVVDDCNIVDDGTFRNKTISDGGITVDFWIIKFHTSN